MREVDVAAVSRSPEGSFEDHGLSGHNIVKLIFDEYFLSWGEGLELNLVEGSNGYCDYNLLTPIDGPISSFDVDWRILVLDLDNWGL